MAGKTVNLNIRTDKVLKDSVAHILHRLGLNHSIVVNMLYRQISLRNEIPFSIQIPNKETQKAIMELESGKNVKSFKNSKELFNDLGIWVLTIYRHGKFKRDVKKLSRSGTLDIKDLKKVIETLEKNIPLDPNPAKLDKNL